MTLTTLIMDGRETFFLFLFKELKINKFYDRCSSKAIHLLTEKVSVLTLAVSSGDMLVKNVRDMAGDTDEVLCDAWPVTWACL